MYGTAHGAYSRRHQLCNYKSRLDETRSTADRTDLGPLIEAH